MTELLIGPWFWEAEDPEMSTTTEDAVDNVGYGEPVRMWEGGVTRIFFAVQMPEANSDDSETREFETEAEALAWVALRREEIAKAEATR